LATFFPAVPKSHTSALKHH